MGSGERQHQKGIDVVLVLLPLTSAFQPQLKDKIMPTGILAGAFCGIPETHQQISQIKDACTFMFPEKIHQSGPFNFCKCNISIWTCKFYLQKPQQRLQVATDFLLIVSNTVTVTVMATYNRLFHKVKLSDINMSENKN